MRWKAVGELYHGLATWRVWIWIGEHEVSIRILETLTVSLPDCTDW
jgi:hypothetical protein